MALAVFQTAATHLQEMLAKHDNATLIRDEADDLPDIESMVTSITEWNIKVPPFPSPDAAEDLKSGIEDGSITPFDIEGDIMQGNTDCPEGCVVEPDGWCSHGWLSAARTAGMI
jgi:folate-dependent tRNA-U54 methylase TrmFO/GidA